MAEFNKDLIAESYLDDETKKMECAMFLQGCLTTQEHEKLKDDWNKNGGFEVIPFWKYVFENVSIRYEK